MDYCYHADKDISDDHEMKAIAFVDNVTLVDIVEDHDFVVDLCSFYDAVDGDVVVVAVDAAVVDDDVHVLAEHNVSVSVDFEYAIAVHKVSVDDHSEYFVSLSTKLIANSPSHLTS